jgi:hypothetical protein
VPIPPNIFAVDERRLRYARFGRPGARFDLEEYQEVDLEHDLFAPGPLGGPLHDPERLRSVLVGVQGLIPESETEASLILPDSWLRLALVDGEELPRSDGNREKVLRWKLQRIVPFRVEELRIRGVDVDGSAHAGGESRVLLGFALETLLRQLEGVFEGRGIHLGFVCNESLALLSGVQDALRDVAFGGVVNISASGYSLTFLLRGEPILHRFKALPQLSGDNPLAGMVEKDLQLTNLYLRELLPAATVGRILLIGPSQLEERWLEWLESAFDLPVFAVRPENVPLTLGGDETHFQDIVTMLGAARQEIQ